MAGARGADWIPAAFLLPAFVVRRAVAVIEAATQAWDDDDQEDEEPAS